MRPWLSGLLLGWSAGSFLREAPRPRVETVTMTNTVTKPPDWNGLCLHAYGQRIPCS